MRPESIKILNAKTQTFEKQGKSHNPLRPEDVSAALAKCEPVESMLGRLVYGDQTQFFKELRNELRLQIVGDERAQNWSLPRPDWIKDMITLALVEAMLERRLPIDEQACLMQIPYNRWYRHWRQEYEKVVESLVQATLAGLVHTLRRAG